MEKYLLEKGIKAKEGLEKKSRRPMFLSNAYGKVQSRYLNSPMGSCHDLCKYGHKHEFDDEEKHTVFRRFMANSIASDSLQNHVNISDRRKSSGLRLEASEKAKVLQPNMKPKGKEVGMMTEIPDKISIKTPSDDHILARPLPLKKKIVEFPLQTILQNSSVDDLDLIKGFISMKKKKKHQAVKPKASPVLERSPAEQNRRRSSSSFTETVLSGGPNILKEKTASYMKETITSSALEVNRQEKMIVRKLSGSSKLQSEKKNVSLPSNEIDGSAKASISLKPSVKLVRSVAQLNDTRNVEGSRNLDMKVSKSFKMLKVGDRNFLKLQKASKYSTTPARDIVSLKVRKFKNLENAALERDGKTDDGGDFHENTREIIQTRSENEGMNVNDENFRKEDDGYTSECCVSEPSESEEKQSCKLSEEEYKRIVRRTAAVKLDNSSSSLPYKMKFRRGRVIDLGLTENIVPGRLRFRKGRVLDEKPSGEFVKRISRRDKGDMKAPGSVAHGNSSEASGVTLKHQDAQEKKDMQALFNYMIEETANKLVETRKSKVKALVGAFETVISLQETKAAQLV